LAVVLLAFAGLAIRPIWDIDFWWHIASGREIVASRHLPTDDPFSVYSATNNVFAQTVLRGQWLGQVLLFLCYRAAGPAGIVALRVVLLTVSLALVAERLRREFVPRPIASVMVVVCAALLLGFTGDRPQLFSFLLVAVLLGGVEESIRDGKRLRLMFIPPMVVLWVQLHGGNLFAPVLLFTVAGAVFLDRQKFRFGTKLAPAFAATGAAALGASLLGPNGQLTWRYFVELGRTEIGKRVSEYRSPLSLELSTPAVLPWIVLSVLTLISVGLLCARRRFGMAGFLIVLWCFSASAYRYLPIFALAATPAIGSTLSRVSSRHRKWLQSLRWIAEWAPLAVALTALGLGIRSGQALRPGVDEMRFPVHQAQLLQRSPIDARIFTTVSWGGYLLWELPRGPRPFIDGRMLDPGRLAPYTHVLWVTPWGKRILDSKSFDLVLIPPGNALTREQYPLVAELTRDPHWRLVARDQVGYLWRRTSAADSRSTP